MPYNISIILQNDVGNLHSPTVIVAALASIRQTTKELHISEKLFTYLLVKMGFAYRTKRRLLMPYAFMVTCGFADIKG